MSRSSPGSEPDDHVDPTPGADRPRPRSTGRGPRTRGGWTPAGTAAARRAEVAARRTARGHAARRQILDAARRVFERDGFADVSIADIVREAGVAQGSFYTYFPSKLDVFRCLSGEVADAMDAAFVRRPEDARLDPVDALARSNERYMAVFREHARIYTLAEQIASTDPASFDRLVARHRRDVDRVASTIRRWQARAVADPDVDPVPTAAALLSMSRHLCYWLYVGRDDAVYDEATALATMNDVWIRTVDLRRRPDRGWRARGSGRSPTP